MVGVNLTTVTAKPMRPATLNAQVAAALYLRCLASPNEAAKKEAIAMLRDTMRILQRETVADIRDMAWGVKEKVDESCFQRVPQDEISFIQVRTRQNQKLPLQSSRRCLRGAHAHMTAARDQTKSPRWRWKVFRRAQSATLEPTFVLEAPGCSTQPKA